MVLFRPPNQSVLKAFSLAGKVAVVTGGARGLGREICKGFAEAGANVAMIYGTYKEAPRVAKEIAQQNSITCHAYQSDVRDAKAMKGVVAQIAKDFGGLDIVVANAGITSQVPIEDATPEEWSSVMKTNLDGVFHTAQAAAKVFKPQGHGNLIITTSMSASIVNLPQKQTAYNVSKAGALHLGKCLAVEWVDWCRVNCISPGFIATEMIGTMPKEWSTQWTQMTPARRFCDPHELKGAYVFCASDASSYMTGAELIIDGGYTLP